MADDRPVDYVRLMREIRDEVNREISGMTFEEEQRWMQEQLAKKEAPVVDGRETERA